MDWFSANPSIRSMILLCTVACNSTMASLELHKWGRFKILPFRLFVHLLDFDFHGLFLISRKEQFFMGFDSAVV